MLFKNRYMGAVRVGAKGQIVIPKEVRDMFAIAPGDNLLLLADVGRGIAINKGEYFDDIADRIFEAKAAAPEEKSFAGEIKDALEKKQEK